MKTITSEMTLTEILASYPEHQNQILEALSEVGLHCMGCHANLDGSLASQIKAHGLSEKALEPLMMKLNLLIEKKAAPLTISLTEQAAAKYLEIAKEEGRENAPLRFGIIHMGCHGFDYLLDFSDGKQEDDHVFTSSSVEIHVNKEMLEMLLGSVIDYVLDGEGGFKITNPNLKRSCCGGCGGCCH